MARSHFQGDHRGLAAAADGSFGRFGRMFDGLEGPEFDPDKLFELAKTMIKDDAGKLFNEGDTDENVRLPAGYTYFGQFVDHDLTLDTTSIGEQESDPNAVEDFRTAALDLDCVYGNGPGGDLVLYDEEFRLKLSNRSIASKGPKGRAPRTRRDHRRDSRGVALIGDPRNDENVIVAQVHQAFTELHNKILRTPKLMANLGPDKRSERFRRAARLTRWHYQWIVVNDFLKRITHPEIYKDIVNPGGTPRLRLYPKQDDVAAYPYMPIEFAPGAYRFGHSMVRPSYALNAVVGTQQEPPLPTRVPIFDPKGNTPTDDLRGFKPIPDQWGIDWGYFFLFGDGKAGGAPEAQKGDTTLQPAYRIDTLLVDPLRLLVNPDLVGRDDRERNLAYLNLLRGSRLRLPTAEQVAERLGMSTFGAGRFPFLTPDQIWSAGSRRSNPPEQDAGDEGLDVARKSRRPLKELFKGHTPLWYYVLREAEWYATWSDGDTDGTPIADRGSDDIFGGHHLGPIGSTIVLETFLGLLVGDPGSYIHQAGWKPMSPIAEKPDEFQLENLIEWALT